MGLEKFILLNPKGSLAIILLNKAIVTLVENVAYNKATAKILSTSYEKNLAK